MGYSKCQGCGTKMDTSLMSVISGKKYCPTCAPARKREALAHLKLNKLLSELCQGENDYLPRINHEIELLINKYNWKKTGIVATLEYIMQLENRPLYNPDNSISWMLEKYYPLAKKYWQEVHLLKEKFPETVIEELMKIPTHEVVVKRSDLVKQDLLVLEAQRTLLYGPPINIDDIDVGDMEDIEEAEVEVKEE